PWAIRLTMPTQCNRVLRTRYSRAAEASSLSRSSRSGNPARVSASTVKPIVASPWSVIRWRPSNGLHAGPDKEQLRAVDNYGVLPWRRLRTTRSTPPVARTATSTATATAVAGEVCCVPGAARGDAGGGGDGGRLGG